MQLNNLNTSHVNVNPICINFIDKLNNNLNTSHVNVNQEYNEIRINKTLFKYISC